MNEPENLMIIWGCECGYEYQAPPDCNENLTCPRCGKRTYKIGEEYDA